MKTTLSFLILFFLIGTTQVQGQIGPEHPEPSDDRCASLINIQQTCQDDGTVTLTFHVSNNSRCHANAISVGDGMGWGQSYISNLPPQTASATQITYSGASPGSQICFNIVLFEAWRECCRERFCIDVIDECCTLDATVVSTSAASCNGDDGEARIVITGGNPNPDYTLEWENTTGPGDGYEEYTEQSGNDGVELSDLAPGVWQFVVTDQNGCAFIGTFVIEGEDSCCSEVTNTTPSDDCTDDGAGGYQGNGTSQIVITNGTPPYTGSYSGPSSGSYSGSSPINLSGLSSGTYYYNFVDAAGCVVSGSFEIEDENGPGDCNAFEAVYATEADANSFGNWSTTVVSSVSATITVTLDAATEPDEAIVTINGNSEAWTAGSDECDDEIYGDVYVTGHVEERSFNIEPCDVVTFEVRGNACPIQAYTVWTLTVECDGGVGNLHGNNGDNNKPHRKTRTSAEAIALERAGNQHAKAVQVFPNPVSDMIKITTDDNSRGFQSVRIFDISGKTILIKDISDRSELTIDLSSLNAGIYFVETTDVTGHKTLERVLKTE